MLINRLNSPEKHEKNNLFNCWKTRSIGSTKNPSRKIERIFLTEDAQRNSIEKIKTLIYLKNFSILQI